MSERDDYLIARRTPTGALDMEYYTELARRERRIAISGWLRAFGQACRHAVQNLRVAATQTASYALSRKQPAGATGRRA